MRLLSLSLLLLATACNHQQAACSPAAAEGLTELCIQAIEDERVDYFTAAEIADACKVLLDARERRCAR